MIWHTVDVNEDDDESTEVVILLMGGWMDGWMDGLKVPYDTGIF